MVSQKWSFPMKSPALHLYEARSVRSIPKILRGRNFTGISTKAESLRRLSLQQASISQNFRIAEPRER